MNFLSTPFCPFMNQKVTIRMQPLFLWLLLKFILKHGENLNHLWPNFCIFVKIVNKCFKIQKCFWVLRSIMIWRLQERRWTDASCLLLIIFFLLHFIALIFYFLSIFFCFYSFSLLKFSSRLLRLSQSSWFSGCWYLTEHIESLGLQFKIKTFKSGSPPTKVEVAC